MSSSWTIKRRAKKAVNEKIKKYRPTSTEISFVISNPPFNSSSSHTGISCSEVEFPDADVSTSRGDFLNSTCHNTSQNTIQVADIVQEEDAPNTDDDDQLTDDDDLLTNEVDADSLWSTSSCELEGNQPKDESITLSSTHLVFLLATWANKHGISNVALSALLIILKAYFSDLPKDARTVLKTDNKHQIKEISGGF